MDVGKAVEGNVYGLLFCSTIFNKNRQGIPCRLLYSRSSRMYVKTSSTSFTILRISLSNVELVIVPLL